MKVRLMYVSDYSIRNDSLTELNKLVQVLLQLALADIKKQGVTPLVLETYRAQARQNYLYCQGRTIAEVTKVGISKSFASKYCKPNEDKITWTRNSVHSYRKAVDIIPQRKINGKWTPIWNVKDAQTQIIIKTMKKYGFEAGANWDHNPDSPHFQIYGDFTDVFRAGKTTIYVTKAVQQALNYKIDAKLSVDGDWGISTTKAVNTFRKKQGYKLANGQLGTTAVKALFS